ncbi:integrase core domain-containing protein [bacterium]|nr:integrase core domain-containing protein [bacterium]
MTKRNIFPWGDPSSYNLNWVNLPKYELKNDLSREARKRLTWFDYYFSHGKNASLTCRYFGIPRKTFYKWLNRYDKSDLSSLESLSRAPLNRRKMELSLEQEDRIVALRKKYIRYGKEKLSVLYEKIYKEKMSPWHIQRVIKKYNLYYNPTKNEKLRRKRKLSAKKKRITELKNKKIEGFFFQADTIVIYWAGLKRYIFTTIDRTSKLGFARMYKTASSFNAKDFLYRLHYLIDGKIEYIQTDNGSEFAKYFERACDNLKINHYFSRVKTPKDNCFDERFNRTLREEFIQLGNYTPFPDVFNKNLTDWLIEYNFNRPHQSLGYLSPIEYLNKYQEGLLEERVDPSQVFCSLSKQKNLGWGLEKVLPMYPPYTKP